MSASKILYVVISLLICRPLEAQTFRQFNPDNAESPYGVPDIEPHLYSSSYGFTRFGNMMDRGRSENATDELTLAYTWLTEQPPLPDAPPYDSIAIGDNRLFLLRNNTTSFALPSNTTFERPLDGRDWKATFLPGVGEWKLMRAAHYALTHRVSDGTALGTPLPADAEKVIVLIHGWQPQGLSFDNDGNAYDENPFSPLRAALENCAAGTSWRILPYRWEKDADSREAVDASAVAIPTQAAEIARYHGYHLGERLLAQTNGASGKLRRVHFVAHSAGSWVARGATKYLLRAHADGQTHSDIRIQVTLLDPFIPGAVIGVESKLDTAEMSQINEFYGATAETLYRLENYYSDDTQSGNIFTVGTQERFEWRGIERDWNRRVYRPLTGEYKGHSGPVQFYADSVTGEQAWNSWEGPEHTASGFLASMFMNEPVFRNGISATTDVSSTAVLGFELNTRDGILRGEQPNGFQGLKWQKRNADGSWSDVSVQSGKIEQNNGLVLTIKNVTAVDQGAYRLGATRDLLRDFSSPVTLTVVGGDSVPPGGNPPTTALIAPTNLAATAVSSSQINLRWTDNSSNESGFKFQRRPATSNNWTDISATASANGTAFSNILGLSPATTYFYRMAAFNSTGSSAWSTEASATTSAASGTTYPLQVDAIDQAANVILAVSVPSWTGQGENYQTKTTGFSRSFSSGTKATVSAPSTLAGGRIFHFWQFDDGTRTYSTTASCDMDRAHAFIAIYGTTPPPARTPTSLTILGDSSVDENSSETYTARVGYSDGTTAIVTGVDWDEDSSYADISSSGRLDTESVSSDKSVTITAEYTAGGVTVDDTKEVTIRNSVSTQTYTLTRNVIGGGRIGYSPQASSYAAGTVVSLHANRDDGWVFSHWTGDVSSTDTDDDITVRMDRNRSVTAHFVVDTSEGNIRVDISPPQAVAEGAQWRYDNFTAWRDSGNTQTGIDVRTNRNVRFKPIPGWIAPDDYKASILGGQTTVVSGAAATYREILGAVQVTIQPPEASASGARWKLDGGEWRESGTLLPDVATGSHTITFSEVAGWSTPPAQNIAVERGISTIRAGEYGPPAGQPLIATITPNSGPIEGGIEIVITGANFSPGTMVTFGGVNATNVTVVDPTQVRATLPPSSSYGSVAVSVISGGQTATRVAAFAYDIPLGMNMTLLSQIGGTVRAVAASGSLVLYGEGCSLVSADFTNPSAPIVRGRLPLPGIVKGIAIVGNHALVANGAWGLQIVDIANPATLTRTGFYDTPADAARIVVSGSLAFIADGNSVQVIDFSDRSAPVLAGVYTGTARDIVLTTINSIRIACVAADTAGVQVFDATNPNSFQILSTIEPGSPNSRIAVNGHLVCVTGNIGSVTGKLYDISNPNAPQVQGQNLPAPGFYAPLMQGNYVYSADGLFLIYNIANPAAPTRSSYTDLLAANTDDLALSGTTLFLANGRDGLSAFNVSNPAAPTLRATISEAMQLGTVVVKNDVAYVGRGGSYSGGTGNGIAAIDVSNRRSLVRRGFASSMGTIEQLLAFPNHLFGVAQTKGVAAFGVGDPMNPVFASSRFVGRELYSAAPLGSNIILGEQNSDGKPMLTLVDGSNLANATPISSVQISTATGFIWQALATSGNTVFALVAHEGLYVYDYTNPSAPQFKGFLAHNSLGTGMAVSADGNYVFLTDSGNGLVIFDCTDRTLPVLLTTYARNDLKSGESVELQGSLVFYGDRRGLNVLDCSNLNAPTLVAAYDTPGIPYDLFVDGNEVFVADDHAGMEVLRLDDITRPIVEIVQPTRNSLFETALAVFDLQGTASDAEGVSRVSWQNDRGGGGEATGTTNWSISGIRLFPGENTLTVTAEDSSGKTSTDFLTVIATLPDTTGPAVLITGPNPASEFIHRDATVLLAGSAVDPSGLTAVSWTNDRGGTGTATGSATWSAEVPLSDGPNRVTITALDTKGNEARTEVIITFLPPDEMAPSVAITFPTEAQEAATAEAHVNISGTAEDDQTVAKISWTNNRGGAGEASGTRVWHVNGIVLQPGANVITVTAEDSAGNMTTDTLAVTFSPEGADPARPVLALQSPATIPIVTESGQVSCSGQASGTNPVTEVVMQLNNGPWLGVTGTNNWSANVTVVPGRNVLRFKAVDASGRESLVQERVVIYRKLAPIAFTSTGEGLVNLAGNPDLTALEVGKVYAATAKPAKGWIFAGWEGLVVSNSKSVSFLMEEYASLTALFVENPYDELSTAYRGLLRATPQTHATTGQVVIKLAKSGALTAQFVIGGKLHSLKGALDGTGAFLGEMKAGKEQKYQVYLSLDTATAGAPVTGLLSDGSATLALNAWPTSAFERRSGAPESGSYTLAIESGTLPGEPRGYGTGRIVVGKTGAVKIAALLANGSRLSVGTAITSGNRVPLYAAMDRGSSSFSASLLFADKSDSDIDGQAFWSAGREAGRNYRFDPFTTEPRIFGQRYAAPAKNERVLAALEEANGGAALILDDGFAALVQRLSIQSNNRVSYGNPILDGFKMNLSPRTGSFSGSVLLPSNGKRQSFGGVLLQKSGEGVGALLGKDVDMAVTLSPAE